MVMVAPLTLVPVAFAGGLGLVLLSWACKPELIRTAETARIEMNAFIFKFSLQLSKNIPAKPAAILNFYGRKGTEDTKNFE